MVPSTSTAATLSRILKTGYNDLTELREMAFAIGAEHYLFQQDTPDDFIQGWIEFLQNRQWLGCLIDRLKQDSHRDIGLPTNLAFPDCPALIKVQVVLANDFCLENWPERKRKLMAALDLQAAKPVFMAAVWNPVRLLLVVPQKQLHILQILYKRHEYGDEFLSVMPFRLLSPLAQIAWQHIAWHKPFRLDNDVLTPTITWQEALLTAVQNPPTPPPHISPPLAGQPVEPTPSPPPHTPPPTEQSAESYPPPIIQPSQPTPLPSPPPLPPQAAEDDQEASPVENIALPIINLGGGSTAQSASSPDIVEEEEESSSDR